jgi:hypothetical protein
MGLQKLIQTMTRSLLIEKENATYEYGCVMLKVDILDNLWDKIK